MRFDEAKDRIYKYLRAQTRFLSADEVTRATGVELWKCRRILDGWIENGTARFTNGPTPVYMLNAVWDDLNDAGGEEEEVWDCRGKSAESLRGALTVETLEEFCEICGGRFRYTLGLCLPEGEQLALLRKIVPPGVAVLLIEEYEDGRRFVDYYFVCCKGGFLYAYQAR